MKDKSLFLIIGLFVCSLIMALFLLPNNDYDNSRSGRLYISEIMAQNNFTLTDNDGKYSDWIELYNGYDYDINLSGYHLTDKSSNANKWFFPDITIKANEYLIIFASGKDKVDLENRIIHTNFNLSSDGEVIMLLDKKNNVINKLTFDKTANDTSYGVLNNKYVYFYNPTPGSSNGGSASDKGIVRDTSNVNLIINEYMTNNERFNYDQDGDYSSWVEIYNPGSDVSLKGMFLSDDENDFNKFKFPDMVLKQNEYLMVYLSGKDKVDTELHASFKLSNSDTYIILSDSFGQSINKLRIVSLDENISYGLKDNEWYYFTSPTPGRENSTQAFEKVDDLLKKKLVINEVNGVGNEWVEIKNISGSSLNLKNYSFYDKKNDSVLTFPSISIKNNDYLVINCGSDFNGYKNNQLYSSININHDGETLYLRDSNNTVIDKFETGKLNNNITVGLNEDFERVFYSKSSKGANNGKTYYNGYASSPIFSIDGGYVDNNTVITFNNTDGTIYYTLDGSYPTKKSLVYKDGIVINKTTVVKAINTRDGYLDSDIISRTFIVGRKHDLAVVSISTDESNLFGPNGIYTNYHADIESKMSFEFYENDGTFGIGFNGGAQIMGQDSCEFDQKSFSIFLRKEYGLQEITYPLFEDHDVQTFSSFILRNSGEDVSYMKIKDTFLVEILKGQMDLDFQYYRPVVVYLNGEYWGIYNIREKINESYLANNHGVDKNNVDLIKGSGMVQAGTYTNYKNLINYVTSHNVADSKVYEYLKTQIDMQELMNYWVVQTYIMNFDSGNIRYWRENSDTGKWRWVLFDLDWSMYPTTYTYVDLMEPFQPYGHGVNNWFSTTLTYNLFKNAEFKDQYLKTFAYHLKNTFEPTRVQKILDDVASKVRSEMPYQIEKFSDIPNMKTWEYRIDLMSDMVQNRYNLVVRSLKSQFKLNDSDYNKYFGGLS